MTSTRTVGCMTRPAAPSRFKALGKGTSDFFAGLVCGPAVVAFGYLSIFIADWVWLPIVVGGFLLIIGTRATWRESRLFGVTTLVSGAAGLVLITAALAMVASPP